MTPREMVGAALALALALTASPALAGPTSEMPVWFLTAGAALGISPEKNESAPDGKSLSLRVAGGGWGGVRLQGGPAVLTLEGVGMPIGDLYNGRASVLLGFTSSSHYTETISSTQVGNMVYTTYRELPEEWRWVMGFEVGAGAWINRGESIPVIDAGFGIKSRISANFGALYNPSTGSKGLRLDTVGFFGMRGPATFVLGVRMEALLSELKSQSLPLVALFTLGVGGRNRFP